jgi:phosphopantothenoylcysteine decarboxylase/phosphopantothenate--cysteine ligase
VGTLKNKKILITAGPTWVALDAVRLISNIASGRTGIILAKDLQKQGARVTLLLGSTELCCCLPKNLRVLRFRFFDELKYLLCQELANTKYDAVIHSAAVSDYKPAKPIPAKIKSGCRRLRLDLVPTEKLINSIKTKVRSLYLVGFKFKPQEGKEALLKDAGSLLRQSQADLVVANTAAGNLYRAFIVDRAGQRGPFHSKRAMAQELLKRLAKDLCKPKTCPKK